MNRIANAARRQAITAGALQRLLSELFDLSTRQVEALDRQDLETLEACVSKKSDLLQLLTPILDAVTAQGWNLLDPASFPVEQPMHRLLGEAAELSRRLQAHEKYVLLQMVARKNQIGDRLDLILNKRNAAAGYRVPRSRGKNIDTAR